MCRRRDGNPARRRAIIVENVMVRSEDDGVYLPVGPHMLKDQIRSIFTVTAKT